MVADGAKQASQVAVPIAAIGIIIAIAIQSNLALKFSTKLIGSSDGSSIGAHAAHHRRLHHHGHGPAHGGRLHHRRSAVRARAAPVGDHAALRPLLRDVLLRAVDGDAARGACQYAAAGLAGAHTMRTSMLAFRMSFVCFLIPFAFVFDPRLLAQGQSWWTFAAFLSMMLATGAWAVALAGFSTARLAGFCGFYSAPARWA
jgi:hypothetical protein